MIRGWIDDDGQPRVRLTVRSASNRATNVDFLIDTGFDGYVTLPYREVISLGLPWKGMLGGMLAHGGPLITEAFLGEVLVGERIVQADIEALDSLPLAGLKLLNNHELRIALTSGGAVEITPLTNTTGETDD